jgi:hypothetical protein
VLIGLKSSRDGRKKTKFVSRLRDHIDLADAKATASPQVDHGTGGVSCRAALRMLTGPGTRRTLP